MIKKREFLTGIGRRKGKEVKGGVEEPKTKKERAHVEGKENNKRRRRRRGEDQSRTGGKSSRGDLNSSSFGKTGRGVEINRLAPKKTRDHAMVEYLK